LWNYWRNSGILLVMWKLIRTLVIAAILIGIGCFVFAKFTQRLPIDALPDDKLRDLLFTMLGILFLAAGAAVLLWPLAGTISYYFESLFWASGGAAAAPPMYKLAAWLTEQGRYGESLAEYQKITRRDGRATVAYEGQLYVMIHAMGMGSAPAVQKLLAIARKKVRPEDLPHLDWFYEQLLAGNSEVCSHPPRVEEV
jgi:MFS family permease